MQKMFLFKYAYSLLVCIMILQSCEKEISLDLNHSKPLIVIEAAICTDTLQTGVRITKTLQINDTVDYPFVNNALVVITDLDTNTSDTLLETSSGFYTKSGLGGREGHTYNIYVNVKNSTYESSAYLPHAFILDSLVQVNKFDETNVDASSNTNTSKMIKIMPYYINDTGEDKYFQFLIQKNNSLSSIIIRNDLVNQPVKILFPFYIKVNKNDTLVFELQMIDKNVYNYQYALNRNLSQFSATPSNPPSNFSNGALGYFKAHTSQRKLIVIK